MSAIKYIPSAITIGNLLCGMIALLIADPLYSPLLILLAGLLDLFDGAAARALNAVSPIGKELDSLCDMVSFGVVPAYLYYLLAPEDNLIILLPSLTIVACAALRLAKFNTLPPSQDFIGLASPAAALCLIGLALSHYYQQPAILTYFNSSFLYIAGGILIGVAMVVNLSMFSLKGLSDPSVRPWLISLFLLGIAIAFFDWRLMLPLIIPCYVLLSLLKNITSKRTI